MQGLFNALAKDALQGGRKKPWLPQSDFNGGIEVFRLVANEKAEPPYPHYQQVAGGYLYHRWRRPDLIPAAMAAALKKSGVIIN